MGAGASVAEKKAATVGTVSDSEAEETDGEKKDIVFQKTKYKEPSKTVADTKEKKKKSVDNDEVVGEESNEKGREGGLLTKIGVALGLLKENASVVVVGLDNSGKTTLLNFLKGDMRREVQMKEVAPTVGFQSENFNRGKLKFTCFDMSGQSKYRSLWEKHYKNCNAIIWVIDTSDPFRMCVVQEEFEIMLDHPDIKSDKVPILFFANKVRFFARTFVTSFPFHTYVCRSIIDSCFGSMRVRRWTSPKSIRTRSSRILS